MLIFIHIQSLSSIEFRFTLVIGANPNTQRVAHLIFSTECIQIKECVFCPHHRHQQSICATALIEMGPDFMYF